MTTPKEIHQLIRQHNVITQARYSLSATELDLFFALLSQIGDDKVSRKAYTIDVKWLEGLSGKKLNTTQLRQSTEKMIRRVYTITEEDGSYVQVALLSSARYIAQERKLILRVDEEMEKYLFDLKSNFTLYYLEKALQLNSKFSKRIYQMLSQFRATGFFKTSIQQLKGRLELYDESTGEEQYKKVSAFRTYVLDVAQTELKDTDLPFEYELIKSGRSFKNIIFRFEADSIKTTKKVSKPSSDRSPSQPVLHQEEEVREGKRTLYERMATDFNLSHEHILSIFGSFNLQTINKALYDIKLQISDGKVSNKKAYTRKWFDNLLAK